MPKSKNVEIVSMSAVAAERAEKLNAAWNVKAEEQHLTDLPDPTRKLVDDLDANFYAICETMVLEGAFHALPNHNAFLVFPLVNDSSSRDNDDELVHRAFQRAYNKQRGNNAAKFPIQFVNIQQDRGEIRVYVHIRQPKSAETSGDVASE